MAKSYWRIEITGFGLTRTSSAANDIEGMLQTFLTTLTGNANQATFLAKFGSDFQERNMINDPIAASVPN